MKRFLYSFKDWYLICLLWSIEAFATFCTAAGTFFPPATYLIKMKCSEIS